MHNLVEKFAPAETAEVEDEGVVSIEYVAVAGIVVAALLTLSFTGAFGVLITKLTNTINSIP